MRGSVYLSLTLYQIPVFTHVWDVSLALYTPEAKLAGVRCREPH